MNIGNIKPVCIFKPRRKGNDYSHIIKVIFSTLTPTDMNRQTWNCLIRFKHIAFDGLQWHIFFITFYTFSFLIEPPWNITVQNANTGVLQGEENRSLVLNCSVKKNSPKALIMWYNGSSLLGLGGPSWTYSVFKIIPQRYDHNKSYTCVVKSSKFRTALHKSIILDIQCKSTHNHIYSLDVNLFSNRW